MKTATKVALLIILIGSGVEGIYYNDYKEAWTLLMIYIVIKTIVNIEKK